MTREELRRVQLDGQPAGTGRCEASYGGLGKIAGVATVPEVRRQGVAGTLTSFPVERHFSSGGSVAWLSAAN
jgi:predicted GNAT family acetyltransferase